MATQGREDIGTTRLEGRVAVVTGGSRGLGAAIAQVLGEAGMSVAIADIAAERAIERAATLHDRGLQVMPVPVDVGDETQVRACIDAVRERWGRLDVLVNNAAIDLTLPLEELDGDAFADIVRVNLTGAFLMSRHAAAVMRAQASEPSAPRGQIVNIASTASKRAWPNASAYHASKWGLLGLSHALHAELRPIGIRVTAIVAGGMHTPFLTDRFPDLDTGNLQHPLVVAHTVKVALTQPPQSVIPELMVLPMRETSWP